MSRTLPMAVALIAVALLLCGLPIAAVISMQNPAAACGPGAAPAGGDTPAVVDTTGLKPLRGTGDVDEWSVAQLSTAAIIVSTGQHLHVPPRGWVIAVATAIQESKLTNLGYLGDRNDHDSLGVFQQRPSQGWGTPEQILNPVYASGKFYEKLLTVSGWQTMRLTDAAQQVQRSAWPDAYQQWEPDAENLVAMVTGRATISDIPGASLVDCGGSSVIAASGWTQPVRAKIVSAYGQRGRRLHAGVDLGAKRYTVIKAAAAGKVVWAGCDGDTGNCDADGDVDIDADGDAATTKGCGWYVDILHADRIATRYCHMVRKPDVSAGQTVQAGQQVGVVGSSGHSSGPHLHFEVHLDVPCTGGDCDLHGNSTDPDPFMQKVCAPLGDVVTAPAACTTTTRQGTP